MDREPTLVNDPTEPAPPALRNGLRTQLPWLITILGLVVLVVALVLVSDDPTEEVTTAPETSSPAVVAGEEPIADAAEVILPSVVHIQTQTGVGSGVIYDAERGLIITAAHVVDGHDTVRVRLSDGEQMTGTVLGTADQVDIAVIEIDPVDLPEAVFSLEKPRVGQLAIAVGSPWGLASTVTSGIISAVDQTNCSLETCVSMVQTDAAINPGNSGGALINRDGEVVGINVSIFTLSGANDGVGFAVPSDIAVEYAESIVTGVPIETPFLGVSVEDANDGRAGALITEVLGDTAAETAGLEVDDVVISVDGVPVLTRGDLVAQVRAHSPGTTIEVVVIRDGDEMTFEVTLGVRSEDLG
ncbi:MAG: trypsin-like peptidase domain-containing protein [Actinobacteria bacterium]|nr:trypsin-like peptidase domain-containing protein [Actinomycetota bacterium]MCI0544469.1 trypsin-like peptidase domain-containing protein [Actinomycetota bacterium]